MIVRPFWENVDHFDPEEFDKPQEMNPRLIRMLDRARDLANIPFSINSGYRENSDTTHGRGEGVDIECTRSRDRLRMVLSLATAGFHRIGVYDRHIHADIGRPEDGFPARVMWWGKSK